MIILVFAGFLYIFYSGITGKASLSIEYNELVFNLKKGELLPINSKLIINQDGLIKEISLSELASSNANGSFYVEGKRISGNGEGYGFEGEKIIYPIINFRFVIKEIGKETEKEKPEKEEKPAEEAKKEEELRRKKLNLELEIQSRLKKILK